MNVGEQIEAMRDEAKGFQDKAVLDLAKQYYQGQVDMVNYILELLPVLAEVEVTAQGIGTGFFHTGILCFDVEDSQETSLPVTVLILPEVSK